MAVPVNGTDQNDILIFKIEIIVEKAKAKIAMDVVFQKRIV